jgi:hypothetical protein
VIAGVPAVLIGLDCYKRPPLDCKSRFAIGCGCLGSAIAVAFDECFGWPL